MGEEIEKRTFLHLLFDLAVDVGTRAPGRPKTAEAFERFEDVCRVRPDDEVNLFADFLGRQLDALLHRLEAQVLPGEILLLLEQLLHLPREAEAASELDGSLEHRHLGQPLRCIGLIDPQLELATTELLLALGVIGCFRGQIERTLAGMAGGKALGRLHEQHLQAVGPAVLLQPDQGAENAERRAGVLLIEQVASNVFGGFENLAQPLAVVQLDQDLDRARHTDRTAERLAL